MHYPVLVILPEGTKEEGAAAQVARLMAPYAESLEVAPYLVEVTDEESETERTYRESIGMPHYERLTAMQRHYGTTDPHELAAFVEDWSGTEGVVVDGKLYERTTYNPQSRWDYYSIQQFHDPAFATTFPDGVGKVADYPPGQPFYGIMTPDGTWAEREPRYSESLKGAQPHTREAWEQLFYDTLNQYTGHLCATLDTHN